LATLREWLEGKPSWVADALYRAAKAGEATEEDAIQVALRVQAANGVGAAGTPECSPFDAESLTPAKEGSATALLGSIGPLDNVDRLLPGQQLKFALDGLTVIYGENGSGKSGYARAARRLCTARVPIVLQSNVFVDGGDAPSVTFALKTGDAEPVSYTWSEGSDLPHACRHMSFLDTANAAAYIEDKTEILFLPPEVQVLTILGQLYVLAARCCQVEVDRLTAQHGPPLGVTFNRTTAAGALVHRLTISSTDEQLPTANELTAASQWDADAQTTLDRLRLDIAQGPVAKANTLRRLATGLKQVADTMAVPISKLNTDAVSAQSTLLAAMKAAQLAADSFAAERADQFPLPQTGGDGWKQLFQLARQFAADASIVAKDAAFAEGDICVLCQRPLDDEAARRMNAFDMFIEDATAEAVKQAKQNVEMRIQQLHALKIMDAQQLSLALAEHAEHDETKSCLLPAMEALQRLEDFRRACIEQLQGGADVGPPPDAEPLVELGRRAKTLVTRAMELEEGQGPDLAAQATIDELSDRKTISECLPLVLGRLEGLRIRLRYIDCVSDLGTGPVSRQATALRSDLVSPTLRSGIRTEIAALGIEHIPLKFTEQTSAGRSFFEMALDSAGARKKKKHVLSEGEQRSLAIACFLADPHVRAGNGALIIDDPVTSLDHSRMRRVAGRLASEAATGRQVIVFTHNLLFYQELLRACADREPQVATLPCLIRQATEGFGLVTVGDRPWIAKKVKERRIALSSQLGAIPDELPPDGEEMRLLAKQFYTDLRETWERAIEEVVLGGVVERFGTDVKTQSLKMVEVGDEDYRTIFFAMKRASERSGHDQAQGRQIDPATKKQMAADLGELVAFLAAHERKIKEVGARRKELEAPPTAATV
jgi:hypothetical protein